MLWSAQDEMTQALVEAAIDAAGDGESLPDDLLVAAYCRAAEILMDEMAAGLDTPGAWPVRWERAVGAVVAAVRARPGLARLTLCEPHSETIREHRMGYRRAFIDVLECEFSDPELPELHAEVLAGAIYRAYVAEAEAGRLTDPDVDVVPKLVNVIAILEPAPA
jgi:hypothetical protein